MNRLGLFFYQTCLFDICRVVCLVDTCHRARKSAAQVAGYRVYDGCCVATIVVGTNSVCGTIGALAGWAVDTWTPSGTSEHIILDTDAFDLGGVSSVKSFSAIAGGFAVVGNPIYGNLIIESSEECDDGNDDNNDDCTNYCVIAPVSVP